MLSLFVHFSVCLCSGKCYQPLPLVVLLSMIVQTPTHPVSSQISPTRSVQLRASCSITPDRRLTYTANFQSLSSELQDSRTVRATILHKSATESKPDLSTITQLSASRTSRQAEPFMHSRVIMSPDITSKQHISSLFPSKTIGLSDRASSSLMLSQFEGKLEWPSSTVIQSIFDGRPILDRSSLSEEKLGRPNLLLLPSFSEGQSEQLRSYTLQWESEQHSHSIFTSNLHERPEQTLLEIYQKLSPSVTELPNLHAEKLSMEYPQSSLYRTSMPLSMVTGNSNLPLQVENNKTTTKRLMESETLGKTDGKHKLNTTDAASLSRFSLSTKKDASAQSSDLLSTETAASLLSSVLSTITAAPSLSNASLTTETAEMSSLSTETEPSSLSSASLSTKTAPSTLIRVPLSTETAALSLSRALLSTETTASSLSSVSLLTETAEFSSSNVSLFKETEPSSQSSASLSIQTSALSLSNFSLSTETATAFFPSASLSRETVTSSLKSVSLSTETAASSLSSASLSAETTASSLSSVSLLAETTELSLASVLLSTETAAASQSSASVSRRTVTSSLPSVSLSTETAASSLSSASFSTETDTSLLSRVSLSTEIAGTSLSSVSLSTKTPSSSLLSVSLSTETGASSLSSVLLSKVTDTLSLPDDSLSVITASKVLSEDLLSKVKDSSSLLGVSLSTETITPTLSEESLSTEIATLAISDISLSTSKAYSPLLEDSFSTVTTSIPTTSPLSEDLSSMIKDFLILSEVSLSTETTLLLSDYLSGTNTNLKQSFLSKATSSPLSEDSTYIKTATSTLPKDPPETRSNQTISEDSFFTITATSPLSNDSLSKVITFLSQSKGSLSTTKLNTSLSEVLLSTIKPSSPLLENSTETKTASTMLPVDLFLTNTVISSVSGRSFSAETSTPISKVSLLLNTKTSPLSENLSSTVIVTSPISMFSFSKENTCLPLLGVSDSTKTSKLLHSEVSLSTKTTTTPLEDLLSTQTASSTLSDASLSKYEAYSPSSQDPSSAVIGYSQLADLTLVTTFSPLSEDSLSVLTATSPPLENVLKSTSSMISENSFLTKTVALPLSENSFIIETTSDITTKSTLLKETFITIRTTLSPTEGSFLTITTSSLSTDSLSISLKTSPLPKDSLFAKIKTSLLSQDSIPTTETTSSLSNISLSTSKTTSPLSKDLLSTFSKTSPLLEDSSPTLRTTSVLSKDSLTTSTTALQLSKDLLSTVTRTLPLKEDLSVTKITPLMLSDVTISIKTITSPLSEDSSLIITASPMLSEVILSTKTTILPLSEVSSLTTISPLLSDSFTPISTLSESFSSITVAMPPLSEEEISTITTTLPVSKKSSSSTIASSMTSNDLLPKLRADMPLAFFSFSTIATTSVLLEESSVTITTTSHLSKDSLSTIIVSSTFSEIQLPRKNTLVLEDTSVNILVSPRQTEWFSSNLLRTDTPTSLLPEDSLFTITASSWLSKVSCSTTTNVPPITEYSSVILTKSSLFLQDPITTPSMPLEDSLLTIKTSLPLSQSVFSTKATSSVLLEYSSSTITTTLPLPEYSPSTIISSLPISEDLTSTMDGSLPQSEDLVSILRASLSPSEDSLSSLTTSLLLSEDSLSGTKASLAKDGMSSSFIQHLNTDIKMQSQSDKSVFHTMEKSFTEQSTQNRTFYKDIQQLLTSFSELNADSIYTKHQMTQSWYRPSVYTESAIPQLSPSDTVSTVKEIESLSEQNVEEWPTNTPCMTSFSETQSLSSAQTATRTLTGTLAPSISSTFMIPTKISSSQEIAHYLRKIFLSYTERLTSIQTESLSSEQIGMLSTFTNEHVQVSKTVDGITNFIEYCIAKSRSISLTDKVFPFKISVIKEAARITENIPENIFSAAAISMAKEVSKVLFTTFNQRVMSSTATESVFGVVSLSSSLSPELIESTIAHMSTNILLFSFGKRKCTTSMITTPVLTNVQTLSSFALEKTEGISSTLLTSIPGAVPKKSLLFTKYMHDSFDKSLPSTIKSEKLFSVKEITSAADNFKVYSSSFRLLTGEAKEDSIFSKKIQLSSEFFDVLMKESKSEPLSTSESVINDIHTLKMFSLFNEFQFSEPAISCVDATLPLTAGSTKYLFLTDSLSDLSDGKRPSLTMDFHKVIASFSEFIALQPGKESSASTPVLSYIPNMSSAVIELPYLQPKSTLLDGSSSFFPDYIPFNEYRITETKRVYKPISETGLSKLPKPTDRNFTLDTSSHKLEFSPIITDSKYLLKERSSPSLTETALIDTQKSLTPFYKITLLKSEKLDSTECLSSFTNLESTQKERLSVSADTSQLVEGTETRLAIKDIAFEKTQIPLTFYSVLILKDGSTLSPSSSEFTVSSQSSTSEATITSSLKVIKETTESYIENEHSSNKNATFKYLTEEKNSSTFKQPTIEKETDTSRLEISASLSVFGVEITSSLKAKVSSVYQSSSVQSKLNKTQLSTSPEMFSSYFSIIEEKTTLLPSSYADSSLSTSIKEHVKSDVGIERTKQSSVKNNLQNISSWKKIALSAPPLLGSWNSGNNIKSAIDIESLSLLFEKMTAHPTIHMVDSSAMLSMATNIHLEVFLTETSQPLFPSDTRSDGFSSSEEISSFLPETSTLISIPFKSTLDKRIPVSTTLWKSLSERSSFSSLEIPRSLTSDLFFSTEETLTYNKGVFSSENVFSGRGRYHGYNQRTQEVVESIVPTTSTDISVSFTSTSFQNKFQLSYEKTIYPSRNMIKILSTTAKTEYLSSTQCSRLFSGQIEEKLSSVTLAMASRLETTELASALATEGMDNTDGVSQASRAKTSLFTISTKNATLLTPSPVVTSDMALSKTVAKTNLESKKIDTVSPLTIGILVKNAVDISSNEFEMKIKEGLKRCYYEGIAKDKESNKRRKRDASSVTVQVTSMRRDPMRPTHVLVEFYVLENGKAQPTTQVLAIFSRLTIAETSAYLSFPVITNVKVEVTPNVEKPADKGGARASFMTYVLVGVTSVGAVITTVILTVWYCQKDDQHLKRLRSSLEDADLKIDIEKGEVVSVSVGKERDLHPYVFDHGKDNFSSVLQHFEWNLTKATGERKTDLSPRGFISEIHSASQRLKRLRKLGFRGSEKRKLGEDFNETCSPTNGFTQGSGHTDDDLNVINDLDKTTNPELDVIQKGQINDSSSRTNEVNLQYQNDKENNTVHMIKINKESSREPFQLNMNIKPNCYPSTSCNREVNDSLMFHSSGLNLKSASKSEKVVQFERISEHRKKKKLRRENKCISAKSTCSKENGFSIAQGNVQSLRPMVLDKQVEGYHCNVKAGSLYASLPLEVNPSVINSVEDDNNDDVFLDDKIPFSDLNTKSNHLSETNVSESGSYFVPRRVKQRQNFSSSGNYCDIIRACDSNTDSFFADKLDERLGDSNTSIAQINSELSSLRKDQGYSSDNQFYSKFCCDSFVDGSEYAGHEFESLNFTSQYTVTDRHQRCEPYMMDNTAGHRGMTDVMVEYRQSGANVCEHVTKMGRFSKKQEIKKIVPQFRKVQYQDQVYQSPAASSTPNHPSPREPDPIIPQETPAFRFNLPKKEVMIEVGIQTSELENRVCQKGSRKNYKNNLSNKENGQQQVMSRDLSLIQDQISEESYLTGKHIAAPDRKLGFNDAPEQKSSHKNGQKLPLTMNKNLSDVDACYLELPNISMNNKVDDISNDAKENIVPGKEVHYHGYLGKKDTLEDKQAGKKRKTSQVSSSLDDAMNTDPKPEEFSKVDDVTGRKTTDSEELLIYRESGEENYPQKPLSKETSDLQEEGGTVSTTIDSVPYFEEVSKVDHTTGGRRDLERKFDQRNRPLRTDILFKNEEKQYEKGPSGKQVSLY